MLEDISIVKFKKYIVPNKSISVKNTQQITQNDVCKFLRNINITTPIVRISKPKFLINSSPMTYEKIIINWKKKKYKKNLDLYFICCPWNIIRRKNCYIIMSVRKIYRLNWLSDKLHCLYLFRCCINHNVLNRNLWCLG